MGTTISTVLRTSHRDPSLSLPLLLPLSASLSSSHRERKVVFSLCLSLSPSPSFSLCLFLLCFSFPLPLFFQFSFLSGTIYSTHNVMTHKCSFLIHAQCFDNACTCLKCHIYTHTPVLFLKFHYVYSLSHTTIT